MCLSLDWVYFPVCVLTIYICNSPSYYRLKLHFSTMKNLSLGGVNVAVHDLILDKTLHNNVLINLCAVEKQIFYLNERVSETTTITDKENIENSIDLDKLKAECKAEMDANTRNTQSKQQQPQGYPVIPEHVSSISQLLDYSTRILAGVNSNIEKIISLSSKTQLVEGKWRTIFLCSVTCLLLCHLHTTISRYYDRVANKIRSSCTHSY